MKLAISHYIHCNCRIVIVLFFITMNSLRMKWGCRGERSKVNNNVRLLRQREHITDGRTSQGQEEAAGLEQVWSEPGTSQRRIWFDQISLWNPRWQLPVIGGGQAQWTLQGGSGMGIFKVLMKKKLLKLLEKNYSALFSLHKFTWNWEEKKRCIKWLHIQH